VATLLFGVETEYAVSGIGRRETAVDREPLLHEMMAVARERLVHLPQCGGVGLFVGNGGRLYIDAGLHLEFSTPECATPDDAVRFVRAGDRIVADLAHAVRTHRTDLEDIVILRTNVDYTSREPATWGSHESYLYRAGSTALASQIIPHLVSRIIYTGAGGFVSTRPSEIFFTLSPRVWHLESEISAASTNARGIFHTKDEALADYGYHRLHLICGESVCSDAALWLRIATTGLIVAMIDAGLAPGDDVQLRAPLAAMRVFASDPTCRATAPLENGTAISAVDIQRHYLSQVQRYVNHPSMPAWAEETCRRWGATLDRIATGVDVIAAELDWAAKLILFRRHAQKRGLPWSERTWAHGVIQGVRPQATTLAPPALQTPPSQEEDARAAAGQRNRSAYQRLQHELFELDMRYGQLGKGGLFTALQRAGALRPPLVLEAAVTRAIDSPPAVGRAAIRGRAIRKLHKQGVAANCDWTGVWDHARNRGIDLIDPLASRLRWTADRRLLQSCIQLRRGRPGLADRFLNAAALQNEGRCREAAMLLDEILFTPAPDDLLYKAMTRRVLIDIDVPRARRQIEASISAAEEFVRQGGHSWRSRILFARARLLDARGLYEDALAAAKEALEHQQAEANGMATETHKRLVLVLCLRTHRFAEAAQRIATWLGEEGEANETIRALSFTGRSELARAEGDIEAALQWSERALTVPEAVAFVPLRRLVGETYFRALLCRGNLELAQAALHAHAPRPNAESGVERYNALLLWADYHLAHARSAAGLSVVDLANGRHYPAAVETDGGLAAAVCALRRAARKYGEALREGRAVDTLLDCDVRQRQISARRDLVKHTREEIASARRRGGHARGSEQPTTRVPLSS